MRLASSVLFSLAALAAARAQTLLTTEPVGGSFNRADYATAAPGDAKRIFVMLVNGVIRVVSNNRVLATPFLDISANVRATGESGLLGLAFDPDYQRNGWFYVCYTRVGDGATIVERFEVSSNRDLADPQSGRVILGPIAQIDEFHNGGCLQFGPDGYLYLSLGDGGSGGDPACNAQNPQSLLGKVLRVDVAPDRLGLAAPTNPFVNTPSHLPEIWSIGFRNPWRFSFDRQTGDLWLGDVGQSSFEEINFQPASSAGGENYGWKVMEGTQCFSSNGCPASTPACQDPTFVEPVHEYSHQNGCAVIGGYVYRGCAIPDLRGTYFYADLCTHTIWSFRYDGTRVTDLTDRTAELTPPPQAGQILRIVSFGEDADGEILIVTQYFGVWRIVPRGASPAQNLGFGTPGTNHRIPAFDVCGRLDVGALAEFRVQHALPNAPAVMLVSLQNNPTALPPFGILVPSPVLFSVSATTDAEGVIAQLVPGGVARGITLFAQWAILDPGGPGGAALSSALAITFP